MLMTIHLGYLINLFKKKCLNDFILKVLITCAVVPENALTDDCFIYMQVKYQHNEFKKYSRSLLSFPP